MEKRKLPETIAGKRPVTLKVKDDPETKAAFAALESYQGQVIKWQNSTRGEDRVYGGKDERQGQKKRR